MNRLYFDAVSPDGDVIGTKLASVGIDRGGKVVALSPIKINAISSSVLASVTIRSENGRCLGHIQTGNQKVWAGQVMTLEWLDGFALNLTPP